MKGLWDIDVQLSGDSFKGSPLLSRLIINIIFVPALLWVISRQPGKTRTQFDSIIYGTYLFLLWSILTIIDIFLRETQTSVKYGYILFGFFIEGIKVGSDILMITGAHRVLTAQVYQCHKTQRLKARVWLYTGEFFILLIQIMALYYLGSLFAHEVLWLGIANTSAVDAVAGRQDSLQSAFFALQWILALMLLCGSLKLAWIEDQDDLLASLKEMVLVEATFSLWVRTLTELIVSTRYRPLPDGNASARDAVYGICTIFFLWLIRRGASEMINQSIGVDPLPGKIEETRANILESVRAASREGNGPPALRDILARIKRDPRPALSPATKTELGDMSEKEAKALRAEHGRYIDSLITRYGHMGLVQEVEVSDSERPG
ncbi:hypothetical protein DL95DRAFT_454491 [Leptodontidium sp. 2 PMI_412]|nr:hypothetical protein DL95DRAFT_454491 [Leptodontidium sp. 2 PMI_412]